MIKNRCTLLYKKKSYSAAPSYLAEYLGGISHPKKAGAPVVRTIGLWEGLITYHIIWSGRAYIAGVDYLCLMIMTGRLWRAQKHGYICQRYVAASFLTHYYMKPKSKKKKGGTSRTIWRSVYIACGYTKEGYTYLVYNSPIIVEFTLCPPTPSSPWQE